MVKPTSENLLLPTEFSFKKMLGIYYHRLQLFMMVVGANLIIGLLLVFAVTNWYIFWIYVALLVLAVAVLIFTRKNLGKNKIEDNIATISVMNEDPHISIGNIINPAYTVIGRTIGLIGDQQLDLKSTDDLEKLIDLTAQITMIRHELEELQSSKQGMTRQQEYEALKYEIHLLTDCLTTS